MDTHSLGLVLGLRQELVFAPLGWRQREKRAKPIIWSLAALGWLQRETKKETNHLSVFTLPPLGWFSRKTKDTNHLGLV